MDYLPIFYLINSSTPSQSYATRSSGQIEITNTTSSNATSEITFGGLQGNYYLC